jgi:uncharacterized protein
MGYAMDGLSSLDLGLFVVATFLASFVAGLAGFAFGIVAAAIWLHFLTPIQTAALIAGFGLIVQGWSVWKLRRALHWGRLVPFLVGGALGVPVGIEVLRWTSASTLRVGIGALLVLFSLYSLARPRLGSVRGAGAVADGAIGVLNGAVGGATGLAGIVAIIWCGVRGWPPAEQRAVLQPVGVSIFVMTVLWLGGAGTARPLDRGDRPRPRRVGGAATAAGGPRAGGVNA